MRWDWLTALVAAALFGVVVAAPDQRQPERIPLKFVSVTLKSGNKCLINAQHVIRMQPDYTDPKHTIVVMPGGDFLIKEDPLDVIERISEAIGGKVYEQGEVR